MANIDGIVNLFNPTDYQRKTVSQLKAWGVKDEKICLLIINPESNKPICRQTLNNAFADELSTCKAVNFSEAINVFYTGLRDDDKDHRLKCAAKITQLCSKGLLDPKIDIQPTDTDKQKFDKIVDGLNTGSLPTYDADSMTKALETKTKCDIENLQKEFDLFKQKMKEKGIEI